MLLTIFFVTFIQIHRIYIFTSPNKQYIYIFTSTNTSHDIELNTQVTQIYCAQAIASFMTRKKLQNVYLSHLEHDNETFLWYFYNILYIRGNSVKKKNLYETLN